jgi:hypothetical protein
MIQSSQFQNTKQNLPYPQKFPNLVGLQINLNGTTLLLGRSSNSQQNSNYKTRKQIQFEYGLNLKGVQTF